MARRILLLTLTAAIILCFLNIGKLSIYILDEARNAACAKEMFFRKDLVVPTFNGELRGDKPPLHYYFMMASYAVFGVTAFAARFFSAIMGVVTFAACVLFTARYYGSRLGIWTGLGILSSCLFMLEFHLSVPDPYLIAFFLLANICFFVALYEQRRWMLLPGYILLGFAVLAKGPVALVLTVLGWLLFIISGRLGFWQTVKRFHLHWGVLLVALVAVPWYLKVHIETNGEWTRSFFLDHNLNRFTSTREGHGGIPFLSVLLTIAVMLPAGILLPRVIWHTFRDPQDIILKFLISLGLAPMLFFLFSSTILPNYVMPGTPFLIMGSIIWLYHNHAKYKLRAEWGVLLIISLAIPASAFYALKEDTVLSKLTSYAFLLTVVPVGVLSGLLFRTSKSKQYVAVGLTFILAFILMLVIIFPRLDRMNPVYQSESIWNSKLQKRYYGRVNPSFVFYLSDPVQRLELEDRIKEPVLILTRSDYSDSVEAQGYHEVFRGKNLFEKGETVIYSNGLSEGARTTR